MKNLSLNDFMQSEVFIPLGMTHSSYVWQENYEKFTSSPHDMMMQVRQKGKPKQVRHAY